MSLTTAQVLDRLHIMADPAAVQGMARYGINSQGTLGVSIYQLRPLAKEIGVDHALAQELWASGLHEARILASYIDDPALVTDEQMERWVADFDSWDVCDQVVALFEDAPHVLPKIRQWAVREEEFVKRAPFAIIAGLAVHAKSMPEAQFDEFLEIIVSQAWDERNYVKKAVNWALRNTGKRSQSLNQKAIRAAQTIQVNGTRAGRWIAADALRELQSDKVQGKLK
jgi:3-methyladenine DNA glycosylase AlkD